MRAVSVEMHCDPSCRWAGSVVPVWVSSATDSGLDLCIRHGENSSLPGTNLTRMEAEPNETGTIEPCEVGVGSGSPFQIPIVFDVSCCPSYFLFVADRRQRYSCVTGHVAHLCSFVGDGTNRLVHPLFVFLDNGYLFVCVNKNAATQRTQSTVCLWCGLQNRIRWNRIVCVVQGHSNEGLQHIVHLLQIEANICLPNTAVVGGTQFE